MKYIVNFFVLLLLCAEGIAQVNLVPNPSFEDTVNCPYAAGDIDKASGWTSFCGSPDFFDTCNHYDWGVPTNIFGYQIPASGSAYAGLITYCNVSPNIREFPACNLTSPLSIGSKYYVSFKVALSLESIANPTNCASDKIGAIFSTGFYTCNSLISNNPPVFTESIITDSLNWTRIFGSFVADSAYSFVVIGNFFDDVNTDTVKIFNSWWSDFSYYYLDDVCVSTDSLYAMNYTYTGIPDENISPFFLIYPNPAQQNLTIVNQSQEWISLSIYNVQGQEMISENDIADVEHSINVAGYAPGLYMIFLRSKSYDYSYQFIKQ